MRHTHCPFLFCLFFVIATFAQDVSISGTVENEDHEPVSYANIMLLSVKDSSLVDGGLTNVNGEFVLKNILTGNYILKASYLENESVAQSISVSSDLNIGVLQISLESKLDEVVVTGSKPRIDRKVDRLVYSIENTAVQDQQIWEVLKNTPGVLIINNQLSVNGSRQVGVLINGRKVHIPARDLINLLSGTSASNVESIEVITVPPAKYSAEDHALINLKMKKNLIAGYNGAIYNRYAQAVLPKHTVGMEHYFKGKKIDFSFNYSFRHDRNITRYQDITNFLGTAEESETWTANQEFIRKQKQHNLSAFLDYELNGNSKISLSVMSLYIPKARRTYDTKTEIVGDSLFSGFDTDILGSSDLINTSYYIDYEQKLNEKGAQLSVNGHYTFYDKNAAQALTSNFFDLENNFAQANDFTINTEQYINIYSLQTDYSSPWGQKMKWETGLKYANIESKNLVLQRGFDLETPGIDPQEAGNFSYNESIYAGYLSANGKWDALSIKMGLRAEHTETQGSWNLGASATKNSYFKLFPSASLKYTPNNDHSFNIYYFRRITRPRYANINPFQIFQSNFSTVEGNPNLMPSTNSYIASGYTLKKKYTIELFYKNANNSLGQLVFQDNELNWLRFVNTNIDRDFAYGMDFIVNRDFTKFWDFYLLSSFYQRTIQFTDLESGLLVKNDQFSWFMRANNNFTFLADKSLTANLSYRWFAPAIRKNSSYEGYGALDFSLRKSLFDNKASLSLGLDDIFNQGNVFSSRNYLDQNGSSFQRTENRLFTVGFRYKFGNSKIRSNKKYKRVEERNRL